MFGTGEDDAAAVDAIAAGVVKSFMEDAPLLVRRALTLRAAWNAFDVVVIVERCMMPRVF